jgi:hypothetical protein
VNPVGPAKLKFIYVPLVLVNDHRFLLRMFWDVYMSLTGKSSSSQTSEGSCFRVSQVQSNR